ncbi:hypothetical protein BX661DRAFT_188218 [Kickxella alabastrina]|uniref:uncharacterized protein n=1 Tax=Kickxella alabastrina TaxID=61397 RepID=UPI00221FF94F|nr:uncharacterized protein BX661DRAFT_188218 [Kickxella alabastrina]KAI7821647.1 hypothetical protein BX661DRAFT_188218 [Kickxella alabastrina]
MSTQPDFINNSKCAYCNEKLSDANKYRSHVYYKHPENLDLIDVERITKKNKK